MKLIDLASKIQSKNTELEKLDQQIQQLKDQLDEQRKQRHEVYNELAYLKDDLYDTAKNMQQPSSNNHANGSNKGRKSSTSKGSTGSNSKQDRNIQNSA